MALLCLSSGIRPRYREDVLRAASMPKGSRLRFRYLAELVPDELRAKLSANVLIGSDVVIAYLARYDASVPPTAVPIRGAKLWSSKVAGQIVLLDFELEEFRVAENVQAFNNALRVEADFPRWEGNVLQGAFCNRIHKTLAYVQPGSGVDRWQDLVGTLRRHRDFDDIPFFYYVTGVYSPNGKEPLIPEQGCWGLKANETYEIRLIQSIPGSDEKGSIKIGDVDWLVAQAEDENVSFLSTNRLAIDSPYDEKIVRLRTATSSLTRHSLVAFQRISPQRDKESGAEGASTVEDAVWQFEMPLVISPRRWTLMWQGLLVGALLAAQALVPIWSNSQLADKGLVSIIAVVIGLLTGVVASFGLRKP